jgi:hypothetical protein
MKDQVYSHERALGIIEESLGSSPRARIHEESISKRAGSILQVLYSEGKSMCRWICYMSCFSSIHEAESLPDMVEK